MPTVVPVVDEGLGNSAYLVDLGDGRALAVDPSRDLRRLREAAANARLRVAFAADTHLHADFLSGAGLSGLMVRDTRAHSRLEAAAHAPRPDGLHDHLHAGLTDRQVLAETTLREPAMSAASQAGLVNNLNDGLAWGLFPVLFAGAGLPAAASECWSRCTRGSGGSGSSSPAPGRIASAASRSS